MGPSIALRTPSHSQHAKAARKADATEKTAPIFAWLRRPISTNAWRSVASLEA